MWKTRGIAEGRKARFVGLLDLAIKMKIKAQHARLSMYFREVRSSESKHVPNVEWDVLTLNYFFISN